jgi:Sulfotransferase domain.
MVNLINIFGRHVRGRLMVIRYEDLVADVEKAMRQIAQFLEIDFSDSLLFPTRNGMPMGEHSSAGGEVKWWREKVDTASVGKRSKYVTDEDICWLEARLNPEMHRWGYTTSYGRRVFDPFFYFSVYMRELLCSIEVWLPILQKRVWKTERIHLLQRGTAQALSRRDSLG